MLKRPMVHALKWQKSIACNSQWYFREYSWVFHVKIRFKLDFQVKMNFFGYCWNSIVNTVWIHWIQLKNSKNGSLSRIFYRKISTFGFNLDFELYFEQTSELKNPQWIENESNIMHCGANKRRNNGMTSNIEFSQQCSCTDAITRERCSAHAYI